MQIESRARRVANYHSSPSDYLRTCLPCPSPLMAALESPPPPSFLQRRCEIGGVLPAINRKQCEGCDGRRNGEILICERRIVRNFSNSSRQFLSLPLASSRSRNEE